VKIYVDKFVCGKIWMSKTFLQITETAKAAVLIFEIITNKYVKFLKILDFDLIHDVNSFENLKKNIFTHGTIC
jgi:hypothetical protein